MKKPMSLENLPQYLESLRRGGKADESLVVDMGRIVQPTTSLFKKITSIAIFCLFLGVSSIVTYNLISTKNITVVLDTNNITPQNVSKIISDIGGRVVSVEQNENSTYKVEVDKLKNVKLFLEGLRKNKDINKVDLEK